MARPNSKYFSSVISKLVAARRREKIVIDEAFKMQLRSELLTMAAQSALPERDSLWEFFVKWRFAFAVVPSALVVMIVAAQFLNMPVVIPTEQRAPISDEADVSDSGYKLKTFPGEFVMPNNVLDFNDESFADSLVESTGEGQVETSVSAPASAAATTAPKKSTSTSAPVSAPSSASTPAPAVTPSPAPYYLYGFPFTYIPQNTADSSDDAANEISQPQEPDAQQVTQSTLDQGTIYNVENNAVQNVEQNNAQPYSVTTYTGPTTTTTDPAASQVVPYSLELQTAPQETQVQTVQTQVVPVTPAVTYTRVQYQLVLTQAKKSALEADVIPSLVGGRTNYSVNVYDKGDGIVAVSITFSDGSSLLRYYKYNDRTGVWDKVQYVERYFYDDSLTYTRTGN